MWVGWSDVSPAENLDQAGEPINKEMLDALADLARADADSEFQNPSTGLPLGNGETILIVGGSLFLIVLMVGHYLVKIVRVLRPIWTTGSDHARYH